MNIKHLFQFLIITILSTTLVGCISFGMTEEKCKELNVNSYTYGRTDALNAQPKEASYLLFNRHKETCTQKYQTASFNQAEYDKGYKAGIKELCTYAGGLSLGQKKGAHPINIQTICPQKNETDFARGYRDGALLYYQGETRSLKGKNSWLQIENSNLESENSRLESENSSLKSR